MNRGFVRPSAVGQIWAMAVAALVALLACFGAVTAASTGGAGTPGAAPSAKGSPSGAPAASPSAGAIALVAGTTSPRKSFYFGYRYPRLSLHDRQHSARQRHPDRRRRRRPAPSSRPSIGKTSPRTSKTRCAGTGRPTKVDRPATVATASGSAPSRPPPPPRPPARPRARPPLSLAFAFYGYAFPILGDHEYGMSAGRFGAGRTGHTHQGQDVMAACGTPLVAARGGTVQYSGYQGAAGNYVVIDGRGTGNDFMYAHLAEPSPLQTGETVRTGQPIGSRRRNRRRPGLPPPLRDLGRARLVRGRSLPSTRSRTCRSGTPTPEVAVARSGFA